MRKISIVLCVLAVWNLSALAAALVSPKEFYQIKIYHLKNDDQEKIVDHFLKTAFLPALHRLKISNIGVFKPIADQKNESAERLIYVLIPFKSFGDFLALEKKLTSDQKFAADGGDYLNSTYSNPPYDRIESILLDGFDKHPKLTLPNLSSPKKERVYELRSYESHTERIAKNKVKMFNDGDEIGLFKRLGFNAVFYGEVISGSEMPNLMYLTTFENRADRDKHWAAFKVDDYWKKLSAMDEYKNNVSKSKIKFLYPTDYSDI
jgi:hypothetical protein